IDNQLRGRSGRQGDPGESRFYLSGEDDLVRLFAGDRIKNIMQRFKIPEDQPMEAKILSNQIEGAQKKVEEQNFVARKNVLKYDDVMNRQRMVIYEQRRDVLEGEDMNEQLLERFVILQVVDQRWREHLDGMDYLREGVHLRAMAQKDPLVEYQHEGHIMFGELGVAIHEEVVLTLFHAQLAPEEADELQRAQQ